MLRELKEGKEIIETPSFRRHRKKNFFLLRGAIVGQGRPDGGGAEQDASLVATDSCASKQGDVIGRRGKRMDPSWKKTGRKALV